MVSRNAVVTRKITRTPEEPVKYHISNSLCFLITFGASKASHGYFMSDEVGWHLSSHTKYGKQELCKVNGGTVDCLKRVDNHSTPASEVEWDAS
jgi:hypothetical protein